MMVDVSVSHLEPRQASAHIRNTRILYPGLVQHQEGTSIYVQARPESHRELEALFLAPLLVT
jgi:hypothetical protein